MAPADRQACDAGFPCRLIPWTERMSFPLPNDPRFHRMPEPRRMTVVIASEYPLLELGLRSMLGGFPDLDLAGVARSAGTVRDLLHDVRPDIVVLESRMLEEVSGAKGPVTRLPRVLVLSDGRYAAAEVLRCKSNVCGYGYRGTPLEQLSTLLRTIAHCSLPRPGSECCVRCPARQSLHRPVLPLSKREREVFEHIGLGESNSGIADLLGRSVKTVEAHRENIKTKLGLDSAYALRKAAFAWQRGELELHALRPAAASKRQRRRHAE